MFVLANTLTSKGDSEMSQENTSAPATSAIPLSLAILRALQELGEDDLMANPQESNMGLKAILFLIGSSEIPDSHDDILAAARDAVLENTEDDENLLILYEKVVINLHSQKDMAAESFRRNEQQKEQTAKAEELQRWESALAARTQVLDAFEQRLIQREATLTSPKKSPRGQGKKS